MTITLLLLALFRYLLLSLQNSPVAHLSADKLSQVGAACYNAHTHTHTYTHHYTHGHTARLAATSVMVH